MMEIKFINNWGIVTRVFTLISLVLFFLIKGNAQDKSCSPLFVIADTSLLNILEAENLRFHGLSEPLADWGVINYNSHTNLMGISFMTKQDFRELINKFPKSFIGFLLFNTKVIGIVGDIGKFVKKSKNKIDIRKYTKYSNDNSSVQNPGNLIYFPEAREPVSSIYKYRQGTLHYIKTTNIFIMDSTRFRRKIK